MKKIFLLLLFSTILYSLVPSPSLAQSKILINEFLIDPQPQSIEVFNYGTESADISDWIIDDSGGTTFFTIPKDIIIFPNQCLVFSADFNLNKSSADAVRLINSSQLLMDSFSYKSSSGSGISYHRIPDGTNSWTTGSANLGFYNSSTEQTCLFLTSTPTPTLAPTPTSTPSPTLEPTLAPIPTLTPTLVPSPSSLVLVPVSYDDIYLSEAMINPPTGEKEWVEIYNDNDFSVFLNNWYIDDIENAGSTPKIFSLEISEKSYAVFNLTSSMFNNDGDSVRLLDFNKNLKDDFEYSKSEQGKTLGRTSFESDEFCLQESSKNIVNNQCVNTTPTPLRPTGSAGQAPTPSIFQTKISSINKSTPINKPKTNNQFIITKNLLTPTETKDLGQVLGTSDEIIINTPNSKSLINLLSFLSTFYSLLTIISILFKMKLTYGKNKNFYSSSFHTS